MNRERTIEEISEICNKACEIIRRTNDGDLLTPKHLYLTECAVNGFLTVEGQKAFDELYHSVMDGKYVKPYLHDIEHITCDNIGYVYYKGINIEHYDRRVIYSAKAKTYFLKLKRRCAFLESIGVEISSGSVVWYWDEDYADKYKHRKRKATAKL